MNAMTTFLALVTSASLAGPPIAPHAPDAAGAVTGCCQTELAEAHELRATGRIGAAHRRFIAVARQQASAGEFPGDALWQAAEISNALGRNARAASELDRVAAYARDYGRPNLEVRALLEAAHFHNRSGRSDLARTRLARMERLLESPDVSLETRQMVAGRTGGEVRDV